MRVIGIAILLILFGHPSFAQEEKENTINIEELEKEGPEKQKAPVTETSVRRNGDRYFFHYSHKRFGKPYVADADVEEIFDFMVEIPEGDSTFEITGEALKHLEYEYNLNGGMLWRNGNGEITRGKIHGQRKSDSTWAVRIEIWIPVKEFPSDKEFEDGLAVTEWFSF